MKLASPEELWLYYHFRQKVIYPNKGIYVPDIDIEIRHAERLWGGRKAEFNPPIWFENDGCHGYIKSVEPISRYQAWLGGWL